MGKNAGMRMIALFVAAFSLSAASLPDDLQRFDQALAGAHYNDAAAIATELIEQRTPADGQPRTDSVINSVLGRLYLAAQDDGPAAAYLGRADIDELPLSARAATALAAARALELRGDRAGALRGFRDAATVSTSESERRAAAIGIARQLIVQDPGAARQTIAAIAAGAPGPDRWQAEYLLSIASSLAGDAATAARQADAAWTDAALAPPRDLAPVHVAVLRAGLAAAGHDTLAERAMLTAANGLTVSPTDALSRQLPVCGDEGISPTDFVIFGIVAGPYMTRDLVPIAASRAQAVAPFYDRLAGNQLIQQGNATMPVGTAVTLSCRSVVQHDFVASRPVAEPTLDWWVAHGLYPAAANNDSSNEGINAVAARIDALKGRFGSDSPLLIAPRLQLMTLLQVRASAGDPLMPGQVAALQAAILAGLQRIGAPEWMTAMLNARATLPRAAAEASDRAQAASAVENAVRKSLMSAPFWMSREFINGMLASISGPVPAPAARFVIDLDARTPKDLPPRERQAWLLTVAQAQRALGLDKQAQATIASAALGKDICATADSVPALLEQHFSYSDYPDELIGGEQEGKSLFEFGLTSSGSITAPHTIMSLPSGLFDAASIKGLSTLGYKPAERGGKAFACRGIIQSVVWKLEDENKFSAPGLSPAMSVPAT